jgi:hypothetical protein
MDDAYPRACAAFACRTWLVRPAGGWEAKKRPVGVEMPWVPILRRRRGSAASIQNGPRRLKQIKALHWQTHARGSFDHQRLFGALANRTTLKCRLASGRRLGMAINGGNGER